jgi:hypothetical protein
MALASTGYFANVVVVDSGGNKSTLRYKLTEAAVPADAIADAATLVAALNGVTDGVVLSYTVGEGFEEDATFFAAEGVNIENVALITAKVDNAELKYANLKIPAPNVGIFIAATGPNSNVVDPADATLQTYLTQFATGGIAYVSDGEALESPGTAGNVKGKRIHRGSRKG